MTAPVLDMTEARQRFLARNTARAVEHTRKRAEYAAQRLLKARARQGHFAVPAGATAEDLMDLIDDLATRQAELHCTIDPKDLACLRSWHATKHLMLAVKAEQGA